MIKQSKFALTGKSEYLMGSLQNMMAPVKLQFNGIEMENKSQQSKTLLSLFCFRQEKQPTIMNKSLP